MSSSCFSAQRRVDGYRVEPIVKSRRNVPADALLKVMISRRNHSEFLDRSGLPGVRNPSGHSLFGLS
jgi:hypothetical protein